MQKPDPQQIDKLRQQFDHAPYPRIPLDVSPKNNLEVLYQHNLVTPYYLRRRKVIDTKGKLILDAGCGSGYKSLILAEANPGATIIGIDLSEESVRLGRERLKYHGFDNVEFHAMLIEDLPQLGLEFDYINCDEVLYLLPDPLAGLQVMKSVLKPNGLIRTNLHHAYQRAAFYKGQALFKLLGLMDESPKEFEQEAVIDTMKALKSQVKLKQHTWGAQYENPDLAAGMIFANHLLVGDKGFTVADLFALLNASELELVSMVNWRQWDVTDLFENPDDLPGLIGMAVLTASIEEKLRMYELLHPIHRLMDFWCAPPGEVGIPVDEWEDTDWQSAIAHLHPQLRNDRTKIELLDCIKTARPFDISRDIQLPTYAPVLLESSVAACLLPLWDGPQPIQALANRYRQIRAVDPATLEPITEATAFEAVKDLLNRLDAFLYVLLECNE